MSLEDAKRICEKYKCGFHQWTDYATKEENEMAGRELCKNCCGTGNQMFSFYQKCEVCNGSGIKQPEVAVIFHDSADITLFKKPNDPNERVNKPNYNPPSFEDFDK